jgi:hypothetical protein
MLDVKPRDPLRLDERGSEWLKQMASPYLELATTRTRSPKFVDALKAMGTADARRALERLARSQDPGVRALAQRALAGR